MNIKEDLLFTLNACPNFTNDFSKHLNRQDSKYTFAMFLKNVQNDSRSTIWDILTFLTRLHNYGLVIHRNNRIILYQTRNEYFITVYDVDDLELVSREIDVSLFECIIKGINHYECPF